FAVLLQERPPPEEPDYFIRLQLGLRAVERDLRRVWNLLRKDRSSDWEYARRFLKELLQTDLYSWRWDGKSPLRPTRYGPNHAGHPCVVLVRLEPGMGSLLDDLLQAARPGSAGPNGRGSPQAPVADLDEITDRPPRPTAAWCLLAGWRVRWKGEPVRLTAQLHTLLSYLLSRTKYPLSIT